MAKPHSIRKSERRLKKIQNKTPISIAEKNAYEKSLTSEKEIEAKIEKFQMQREEKLEKAAKMLGIDKIDRQIEKLQEQLDELYDNRIRFEDLVIKFLSEGGKIQDFVLRVLGKRYSVSYKSICDEVFASDPNAYEEAKAKHGSRKEEYVLVFKGEEVNRFHKVSSVITKIKGFFKKSA